MSIKKKYIPLAPNSAYHENNLCVSVEYNLGGTNYFFGKEERRGYYLHVTPMERKERECQGRSYWTESVAFGTGLKYLLKEVKRASKGAEAEALKLADQNESWLVQQVLDKNGYKLAGG